MVEVIRGKSESKKYNAEIKKKLPVNGFVWRDFEHRRFAVIDGHIVSFTSPDKITDVAVSNIVVVIADPKMYDVVGQHCGGGIWPIKDVKLVSKKESKELQKKGLLY